MLALESADQEKTECKMLLKNLIFEPWTADCTPLMKDEKVDNKLSSLFVLNPAQTFIKQEILDEENESKTSSEETSKPKLKQNISKCHKSLKVNTTFANSTMVLSEPDKQPDSACTIHDATPYQKFETEVKIMEPIPSIPSAFNLPPKICKRSAFKRYLSDAVIKEGFILW